MKNLIRDTLMRKFESVNTGKHPKGVLAVLRGPCMEIENVNENGRWYPRELIVKRILNDPDTQNLLKNNALLGEGCHPEERFHSEYPSAAILVQKLWIPEDDQERLWIELWVLDTPIGRIIKTLVDVGSSIGISARAVGESEERDGIEYMDVDTYTFFTFDCVPDPGFKTARPIPVNENKLLGRTLEEYTNLELEQTQQLLENINPEYFAGQITQVKALLEQRTPSTKEHTSNTFEELCEAQRRIATLEKSLERKSESRTQYSKLPRSVVEQSVKQSQEIAELRRQNETLRKSNRNLKAEKMKLTNENKELTSKNRTLHTLKLKLESQNKALLRKKDEAIKKYEQVERQMSKVNEQKIKANSALEQKTKNQISQLKKEKGRYEKKLYEAQTAYLSVRSNLPVSTVRDLIPCIEDTVDKYLPLLRKYEQHHSSAPRGQITENTQDESLNRLVNLIGSQGKGI